MVFVSLVWRFQFGYEASAFLEEVGGGGGRRWDGVVFVMKCRMAVSKCCLRLLWCDCVAFLFVFVSADLFLLSFLQ